VTTAAETRSSSANPAAKPGYRVFVLFMLFVVYAFNFLDRQILGILAVSIQEDLGLSDRQLGLLGGIAFAALYSTLGVPIAWLADRTNRTWIITVALAMWSGFTALCGLAQNFWQLFLSRVGVGVGEAGGVAPSYSLIADYFPPQSRARALAVYSLGIPIGSAFGVVVGAQISGGGLGEDLDWRSAFIIVGLAGVILAPLFKLLVREPIRGGLDAPSAQAAAPAEPAVGADPDPEAAPSKATFFDVLGLLITKPSFWFLVFGASASSMMGYGVFYWIPSFFVRSFFGDLELGQAIIQAGWLFGGILFIGGTLGIVLGGVLSDWMGKAKKTAYALVPAIAFFLTAPFYVAGALSPTASFAFVAMIVPTALGLAWLGPVLSAFQHLVPPHMRTMASSIFLLINNLLGIGVGVYVLGELSTVLQPTFGDESLRYSIMIGSSLYVLAGVLFLFAAKTLDRDWVR